MVQARTNERQAVVTIGLRQSLRRDLSLPPIPILAARFIDPDYCNRMMISDMLAAML
jgi:hypothetical protein